MRMKFKKRKQETGASRGRSWWKVASLFFRNSERLSSLEALSWIKISAVQFSHSVVSNSLQPHRLQHARPPYASPTPGVSSNSCPLSQWCHRKIKYQDSGPTSSCWLTTLFSFPREALWHQTQQIAWLRHQSDKCVIKQTFQVLRCSNLLSPNVMSRFIFPGATSVITQGALVVKEPICQCRRFKRHGFNPWVGKILWRRKWLPIPVFLPDKCHGQRSLVGYSP